MIAIHLVASAAHGTGASADITARPGKSLMEAAVAVDGLTVDLPESQY